MIRTAKDYSVRIVKRRKPAFCKHCESIIDIGNEALLIECEDYFSGFSNMIGVIHPNCMNEFILNNINESNKLYNHVTSN